MPKEKELSSRILGMMIIVIALVMCGYQFASTFRLWIPYFAHQTLHLSFGLILVFLVLLKASKKRWWPLTLPFLLMGLATTGYILWHHDVLFEFFTVPTTLEVILAFFLTAAILEGARRSFGLVLPIVALIFIAYVFLGQYLPQPFWHFPLTIAPIANQLVWSFQKGIFGSIMALSANFLFVFVMYGALLQATGGSRFFVEVGKLAGRRFTGGSGLTAVVSSALVGTTTGAAMANVAITGPFTIPMMKERGYSAEQAGAIEATASTGGHIMPPIMGVSAFIMAQLTGVPYIKIITYAAIPAILFYFCVALFVQLNALKLNIRKIEEPVDYHALWVGAPIFIVPLVVLVTLLVQGHSLGFSIFFTLSTLVITSLLRKETRGTWKGWVNALTAGAVLGSRLALVLGVVGVIIAALNVTGLAMKFPAVLEALGGGMLIPSLLVAGLIIIILGCGLPPMASYVIAAMLIVPVLIKLGVAFMSAHFFVYYFAVMALITPPVGASCLVAAPLAGAKYLKLSVEAMKAAVVAWLLPFLCVFVPIIILHPVEPLLEAIKLIVIFITVLFLQVFAVGYYIRRTNLRTRSMAGITAAALLGFIITSNYILLVVGLALSVLLTLWQLRERQSIRS